MACAITLGLSLMCNKLSTLRSGTAGTSTPTSNNLIKQLQRAIIK